MLNDDTLCQSRTLPSAAAQQGHYYQTVNLDSIFHPDSPPSPPPPTSSGSSNRKIAPTPRRTGSIRKSRGAEWHPTHSSGPLASAAPISTGATFTVQQYQRRPASSSSATTSSSAARPVSTTASSQQQYIYSDPALLLPAPRRSASPKKMAASDGKPPASPVLSNSQSSRLNSQPATAQAPHEEEAEPILETPRRGRRLGRVSMGWESPAGERLERSQAPATVPRATASSIQADASSSRVTMNDDLKKSLSVTPRKRRAAADLDQGASASTPSRRGKQEPSAPSLLDDRGYASAAFVPPASTPELRQDESQSDWKSMISASPSFNAPPTAPARFDHLAAFRKKQDPRPSNADPSSSSSTHLVAEEGSGDSSNLVAVDVKGMGRFVVHRSLAMRLSALSEDELRASQAQLFSSSDEANASASGSNDALSSNSRHSSNNTSATSLDTPAFSATSAGLGPSPSFSLASHFPASEEGSPVLRAKALARSTAKSVLSLEVLQRVKAFKTKLTAPAKAEASTAGPSGASSSLPSLDWPDTSAGPWADASTRQAAEDKARLEVVSRWLDLDGDDGYWSDADTTAVAAVSASHRRASQHPMVSKVIRDRNKKLLAAMTASRSMPDLSSSSRRKSRKSGKDKGSSRSGAPKTPKRSRQHFLAAGAMFTPSSLGRSVISAQDSPGIIACGCGSKSEDIPMVQCDGCHAWYHMRCAGIRHSDELSETWFCAPCEALPASSAFTPLSTMTLDPTTIGSTPGFSSISGSASMPAFPRTYAAHIGVGTPSYSRVRGGLDGSDDVLHHLPVFAPAESPMYGQQCVVRSSSGLALPSSSLALAPSPHMDETSRKLQQGEQGGRSRASRIGWQNSEPGSPLDRKSSAFVVGPVSSSQRLRTPSYGGGMRAHMSNARGSVGGNKSSGDEALGHHYDGAMPSHSAMRGRGSAPTTRDCHRTPSPSRSVAFAVSTPSRHARSGRDEETAAHRDVDDVFSTPNRHLAGAANSAYWTPGKLASHHQHMHSANGSHGQNGMTLGHSSLLSTPTNVSSAQFGLQTPSRSTRRREPSGWALNFLQTPGRDGLLSDMSGADATGGGYPSTGGLPSLVFSSGGDVLDSDIEANGQDATQWMHHLAQQQRGVSPTRSLPRRQKGSNATESLMSSGEGSRTPLHQRGMSASHGAAIHRSGSVSFYPSTTRTPSSGGQRRQSRQQDPASSSQYGYSSDYYDDHHDERDPPTSSSPYPRTPSMMTDLVRGGTTGGAGMPTPGSPTPNRGLAGGKRNLSLSRGGMSSSSSSTTATGPASGTRKASTGPYHTRGLSGLMDTTAGQRRGRQPSTNGEAAAALGLGLGLDLDEVLDYW